MVMAGGGFHDGLFRVALKSAGQSADVVMAVGECCPSRRVGAGLVVVVGRRWSWWWSAAHFLPGLKMSERDAHHDGGHDDDA